MTNFLATAAFLISCASLAINLHHTVEFNAMGDAAFVAGHWTSERPCGPNMHQSKNGGISASGLKFDIVIKRYICD